MTNDRWSEPFEKLVTLGESHTAGASATRREYGWPPRLKANIDEFQDEPVALVNNGLGSDVLSRACPLYEEFEGQRPIGIERYWKHVIEERPDLVVVSYGYNDMRAGTPLETFTADLERMVRDICDELDALVVLLDTYYAPPSAFENSDGGSVAGSTWTAGSPEDQRRYNAAIERVAEETGTLFASAFDAMNEANWLLADPSGEGDIHAHDLGHRLIADRAFQVLAANCSGLAAEALAERERVGKSPWRAGGREAALIADFYPESPYIEDITDTSP